MLLKLSLLRVWDMGFGIDLIWIFVLILRIRKSY